ncbi:uncharacterized protein LOC108732881 isoform X4 [Agrilus planipennis]|nr:uncharacterized protein LOC108732881 isoform X4 [Agrilus planipennis]XP_025832775.1 uncharacterized protein LOC108732881 isoform X4 [Agrilus planipennis]
MKENSLQTTIMRVFLTSSAHAYKERKTMDTEISVSEQSCRDAIEKSNLPEIIAHMFVDSNDELYKKLLNLAYKLAEKSKPICQKFVMSAALTPLMLRFYPKWKECDREERFETEIETTSIEHYFTVTNLIALLLDSIKENFSNFKKIVIWPTSTALKNFLLILRVYTKWRGYQVERNSILAIFLKILSLHPLLSNLNTCGFANDLALLSVATEMGTAGTWASTVTFLPDERDYEFKRMLLIALCLKSRDIDLNLLKTRKVIPGLLRIITPGMNIPWRPDFYCGLLRLAFYVLQLYLEQLSSEFMNNNGPVRTLMMIEYYTIKPYSNDALISALHFLKFLTEVRIRNMIEELEKNHCVEILLCIWEQLMANSLRQSSQKCLMYIFFILNKMNVDKQKDFLMILHIELLKRVLNPTKEDVIANDKMLVTHIRLLWNSLTSFDKSFDSFIANSGIFILLDTIKNCTMAVKAVALGLLVDLCEEGTCIPYVVTWRSRGKTFLNLLIDIFMEENRMLKVKVNENCIIKDPEWPICGHKQKEEIERKDKNSSASPSTIDLLGSCRSKVYALLQILNFIHEEKVEMCNEQYHIFDKRVSITDQISLLLAQNYLLLKLGEVWSEIQIDLINENLQPIDLDSFLLDTVTKYYRNWGLRIQEAQHEIIQQNRFKELIAEKELYLLLKEARLSNSYKALVELKLLARSSEIIFRLRGTQRQRKHLNLENMAVGKWMFNLPVQPIYHQHIKIPIDETKLDEKCDLDAVSSAASTDNECNIAKFEQEESSEC